MFIPHYVSCVMCHVSCFMFHVSSVTCFMSPVIFIFFFFFSFKTIGQSGGASRRRVCFQRGLPRLVKKKSTNFLTTRPGSSYFLCLKVGRSLESVVSTLDSGPACSVVYSGIHGDYQSNLVVTWSKTQNIPLLNQLEMECKCFAL